MTMEQIVGKSQPALKQALIAQLRGMGYRTVAKKGFTYGAGTVPVLLVAHLDTVHTEPVKTICYSHDGKVIMSPQGIGGDDRAGVYMILRILKRLRCYVLFCEDEEAGGIGATKFTQSGIRPEVNYIIELDRRGADDAVFYDCDNPDFTKFVCGFGFEEDFGSFSDISIIAPHLGIAAANISAGYYNEHTRHEHIDLTLVEKNIRRIGKMVSAPSGRFEYIEAAPFPRRGSFRCALYGDALDFHSMGVQGTVPVMQLSKSSVIRMPDGELLESDIQHVIDESGTLYEYLFELDAAVEMDGCAALTEHGLPIRFQWDEAEYVDILAPDDALDEGYVEDWIYG